MAEKMISAKAVVDRLEMNGHLDDIDGHVPQYVLDEISKVLTYGDLVYPDVDWRKRDFLYHMKHANDHLSVATSAPLAKDESGCLQLAHAIVRLMFAMAIAMMEEEG